MNLGPLDVGSTDAPATVQVGLVGTPSTVEGASEWLLRCWDEVPAKESNQPNLFPRFPGFSRDVGFRAAVAATPQLQRTIAARLFEELVEKGDNNEIVRKAVDLFIEEFQYLVDNTAAQVLVCAVPPVIEALMDPDRRPPRKDVREPLLNFHNMLKAKAMPLRRPVQLILPGTYDPRAARKQKFREQTRRLQDKATRAWNFHTALYYKAGGRPWRLVRDPSALTTCYVGISFYHALDRSRVMTSMAEVFDERGEGLVVRGGAEDWQG